MAGQTGDTLEIVNIDGGTTTHVVYDFNSASNANQAYEKAEELSDGIVTLIDNLRNAAATSASNAENYIRQALQFNSTLEVLEYDAPEFDAPDANEADFGNMPSVSDPGELPPITPFTPIEDSATFTPGANISAPSIQSLSISAPPSTAPGMASPAQVDQLDVTSKTAPTLEYSLKDLPTPSALAAAPELDIEINLTPIDPAQFTPLDDSDLEAAISRMNANAKFDEIEFEDFEHLAPKVFDVVGQLLSGELVGEILGDFSTMVVPPKTITLIHDSRVNAIWAKRGFTQPEAIGPYVAKMRSKVGDRIGRSELIQREKWQHQAMLAGYDLGVVAYSLLIDIAMTKNNLEFAALTAEAETAIELTRAAVAAYNAKVSIYAAEAEVYNSELVTFNAALAEYKNRMSVEELKGRVNTTLSDAFSAGERAKAIEAAKYETAIRAEAAKLTIYESRLRNLSLDVLKHEADVEGYKAEVLRWEGDLQTTLNYYTVYSAQAKAFSAQMRGQAASQALTQAENKAIEAKAQTQASQITVAAAKLTTAAAKRASQYAADNAENEIVSAGYTQQLSGYIADLTARSVDLKTRSPALTQLTTYNDASLRYMNQVMASVNRAATLTQQGNIQLANAFSQLNETAGRAGASIEQGKLAGFRVSATIGASGSVSGSMGWTRSLNNSSGTSVSDTESVSESLSA